MSTLQNMFRTRLKDNFIDFSSLCSVVFTLLSITHACVELTDRVCVNQ